MMYPTTRLLQIQDALGDIETSHKVTVLFAVESGSRAWGFESTDSDYDVRGVHLSQPSHYLRVHPARDVIENGAVNHPDKLLDFSFWDIQKLLSLATKSNPSVFEWLQSPLIYREDARFAPLRALLAPFYSPCASAHHYLSMAKHNYREHMRGGAASVVKLKKFLYITRPLLCLRWIEANPLAGPPPMAFMELVLNDCCPTEVGGHLINLVHRKRRGEELNEEPTIPVLVDFINAELARWEADNRALARSLPHGTGDIAVLDDWLCKLVTETVLRDHR